MDKERSSLIIALACCWATSVVAGAAEPARTERSVMVQGHGKISAVPDQARLLIQVSEEGARVDSVSQEVRRKMDAVLKVLKAQGLADKDIQTQFYRVAPKMEWKGNRSTRV